MNHKWLTFVVEIFEIRTTIDISLFHKFEIVSLFKDKLLIAKS